MISFVGRKDCVLRQLYIVQRMSVIDKFQLIFLRSIEVNLHINEDAVVEM